MARGAGRLSPLKFRKLSKIEGLHCDGGGLYFQVTKGKDGQLRRSWLFRFALPRTVVSRNGRPRQKSRDMGLGSLNTFSLAEAREAARRCRQLRAEGIDPIEHRKAQRAAAAIEASKARTFDECRDAYLKEHRSKWRNLKHATEWTTTLRAYVTPVFGKLPVKDIDLQLVIKALEPIWSTKTETASRVRGRIEAILDWAAVSGFRGGDNPARWDLLSKRFARLAARPGQAPCRPALRRDRRLHGRPALPSGSLGARAGVCHPYCGEDRRGARRGLGGNRLRVEGVDGTGEQDEIGKRASGAPPLRR